MSEIALNQPTEASASPGEPVIDSRPFTEVAVGLVHRPQEGHPGLFEVLMGQRPPGKPYAGWWEFPGGKIESGESVSVALARELDEELAVRVNRSVPWVVRTHSYPHARVRLHFQRIFDWSGEPVSMEQQAFAWQALDRIVLEPLLPAALPLLDMLRWPARVVLLGFKEATVNEGVKDLLTVQALLESALLVDGDRLIIRLGPLPEAPGSDATLKALCATLGLMLGRAKERNLHLYIDQAWHALLPDFAGCWRALERDGQAYLEVLSIESFFEITADSQSLLPRALVLMESHLLATRGSCLEEQNADRHKRYQAVAEGVDLPLFWPREELLALGGHGFAFSL